MEIHQEGKKNMDGSKWPDINGGLERAFHDQTGGNKRATNERRQTGGGGQRNRQRKGNNDELTDEEIDTQIRRLRNSKAVRENGIKNEAWKYLEGKARQHFKVINKRGLENGCISPKLENQNNKTNL